MTTQPGKLMQQQIRHQERVPGISRRSDQAEQKLIERMTIKNDFQARSQESTLNTQHSKQLDERNSIDHTSQTTYLGKQPITDENDTVCCNANTVAGPET
jgi:hypothetical protein